MVIPFKLNRLNVPEGNVVLKFVVRAIMPESIVPITDVNLLVLSTVDIRDNFYAQDGYHYEYSSSCVNSDIQKQHCLYNSSLDYFGSVVAVHKLDFDIDHPLVTVPYYREKELLMIMQPQVTSEKIMLFRV